MSSVSFKTGTLFVEWDTGFKSDYRFGTKSKLNDKYDVQLCNEPRILVNELIATGCLVTRGKTCLCASFLLFCFCFCLIWDVKFIKLNYVYQLV